MSVALSLTHSLSFSLCDDSNRIEQKRVFMTAETIKHAVILCFFYRSHHSIITHRNVFGVFFLCLSLSFCWCVVSIFIDNGFKFVLL